MSRPVLYLAITSHGFGHAVRAASVAAAIQQLCPEILLVLVTTAPRWLLESYISGEFIHRPRSFDVGVIQADSLTMDKDATLEKLRQIRSSQNSIIAGEVNFIRTNRVGLILADIPHLAANIAQAAGIPCWMMSNFGWDYIYRDWGGDFVEIVRSLISPPPTRTHDRFPKNYRCWLNRWYATLRFRSTAGKIRSKNAS
jgi:hypothetical protein